MGIVSRSQSGGGGLPGEWTVGAGGGLEIDLSADEQGLVVSGVAVGQTFDIFDAFSRDTSGEIKLQASGKIVLTSALGGDLVIVDTNDFLLLGVGSTVGVTPDGYLTFEKIANTAPPNASISSSFVIPWYRNTVSATRLSLRGKDQAGTAVNPDFAAGALVALSNAAPADASLAAGEMAIWYDSTNGASKLMVKAKQADGTVKTAAVALA